MKNKVAFIIPGYTYTAERREYKKVASLFADRGITPVKIEIDWKTTIPRSFDDYVKSFLKQTRKHKNSEIYVLGFSFGAVIALLASSQLNPKCIILCSLSPYFLEDWKNLKKSWLAWWKKNYKDTYEFEKIAKDITARTFMLVGEKEDVSCITRAKHAKKKIVNSSLKIIKDAEHKLQQKQYLLAIESLVKKL